MRTVRELLHAKGGDVWSIAPDKQVYDAIESMADKSVGALLVMEGDRLVGIISERDYARKVILAGRSSKETPVLAIMTSNVICCALDQTIEECMTVMTRRKIRHLPIVDDEKVVGVISIGDLVKAIIVEQKHEIEQLENYISG